MWCFAEDRHYFSSIKFITCRKQIVVTVTQVSEEHHFHLRPMIKNSLVFLTSKDKVLQFHFPQEERAHLFTKGIKNIWIFEHIYSFFPFNVFLEPQKYRVYADCMLYPYSSPSTPTQNPSWQTVSNRLQTRGERIYLNTSFQTILSGSGCQQGKKKPLAAKKGFPVWFSGQESACLPV